MIEILRWLAILIVAALRERGDLALENLALRQQLGVLRRNKGVPRLRRKDRVFWVVLSGIWPHWTAEPRRLEEGVAFDLSAVTAKIANQRAVQASDRSDILPLSGHGANRFG